MTRLKGVNACVFDAYGTLFDINAPVAKLRDEIGEKADKLAEIWRAKQLAYSWLRSLMQDYVEFWAITGDALDFAMRQLEMDDPDLRERLMTSYKTLDAYPEALDVLTALKQQGLATRDIVQWLTKHVNAGGGTCGPRQRARFGDFGGSAAVIQAGPAGLPTRR